MNEEIRKIITHPKIKIQVKDSRSFPDRSPKVVIVPSPGSGNFDIFWTKTGRKPYRKLDLMRLLELL